MVGCEEGNRGKRVDEALHKRRSRVRGYGGHPACRGTAVRLQRQSDYRRESGGNIVRIFGKVRHRPSASWRQATDRAFTLIGDGRYEDAGALLTRAADLEPWLSESWFNLALLHKFRHDWEQARAAGLRAV